MKMQKSLDRLYAAFLDRVDLMLSTEKMTLEEVGKLCGVGKSTVIKWRERDIKTMDVHNFGRYCDALGLSFDDEDFTLHPMIRRIGKAAPEVVQGSDLAYIPIVGEVGAGPDIELFSGSVEATLPILPRYYRPEMWAVRVGGDSMAPIICRGAYVGVIPLDGEIEDGAIYLVQIPPFGYVVKRVRMNELGQIVLHSENPDYKPQILPYEGYDDVIKGRVIWVWQTV